MVWKRSNPEVTDFDLNRRMGGWEDYNQTDTIQIIDKTTPVLPSSC
jgi:hypothetical protein